MRQIDGKFRIEGDKIISVTGREIPEDEPLFLLRARDTLALPLLQRYLVIAVDDNCTDYHLEGIRAVIAEFQRFSLKHPERLKQPGGTKGL
jgi:hypothetical protein